MEVQGVTFTGETPKMKSSIKPKDFGNAGIVVGADSPQTAFLCILLGKASSVISASNPDGEVFEGLGGSFIVIRVNTEGKETGRTRAGRIFFPTGFAEGMISTLKQSKEDNEHVEIRFAYKVFTEKADNKAGRSWAMQNLLPATEADPLGDLMSDYGGVKLAKAEANPALEDKSGAASDTPSEEKPKAGAKK